MEPQEHSAHNRQVVRNTRGGCSATAYSFREQAVSRADEIGLALSGGGVRATVFHLGVLDRLAADSLLERVRFISTVSGGSLAAALVFALADSQWPSSRWYREEILPRARGILTGQNLQRSYALRSLLLPWRLLAGRASILADLLEEKWDVHGRLSQLPKQPRWIVNTTCYETGKNFRFMNERMGDYVTGYVLDPSFPVSKAVAASAAFPGLIGPLSLKCGQYAWHRNSDSTAERIDPDFRKLHLWDGGVYDNLGVEALFKPGHGIRDGVDFLIVSDASAPLRSGVARARAPLRLVDVATDQVRALRARIIVSHFLADAESGVYLRIGNTSDRIYEQAGAQRTRGQKNDLSRDDVGRLARMKTTLRRLTAQEFSDLLRHGYEVADSTLSAYCPGRFSSRPLQ